MADTRIRRRSVRQACRAGWHARPGCGWSGWRGLRCAVRWRSLPAPGGGRSALSRGCGRQALPDFHGDTAWSLIAQLRMEEAEVYLKDRHARGFNTLLVSLLEHRFASHAPANAYGEQPFLAPGDYASPNEAYFAHADRVLRRAGELGFLVLLTPSYLGVGGGGEGWYRHMVENGPVKLRRYGERIWAAVPATSATSSGFMAATSIRRTVRWSGPSPTAFGRSTAAPCTPLIAGRRARRSTTGQRNRGCRSTPPIPTRPCAWRPWRNMRRPERLPFFLIESAYENEYDATEQRLRAQAYEAMLCGAAGQVFGNNPIWHFGTPGARVAPVTWRQALDGRGSWSMAHLRRLFTQLPWWLLEPDLHGRLVTEFPGIGGDRPVAASASDGSMGAYLSVHTAAGHGGPWSIARSSGRGALVRPGDGALSGDGGHALTRLGRHDVPIARDQWRRLFGLGPGAAVP